MFFLFREGRSFHLFTKLKQFWHPQSSLKRASELQLIICRTFDEGKYLSFPSFHQALEKPHQRKWIDTWKTHQSVLSGSPSAVDVWTILSDIPTGPGRCENVASALCQHRWHNAEATFSQRFFQPSIDGARRASFLNKAAGASRFICAWFWLGERGFTVIKH